MYGCGYTCAYVDDACYGEDPHLALGQIMYGSIPLDDLDVSRQTDIFRILYDLYDLYDLPHVAGWDPYTALSINHMFLGLDTCYMVCRSRTISHSRRRRTIDDLLQIDPRNM